MCENEIEMAHILYATESQNFGSQQELERASHPGCDKSFKRDHHKIAGLYLVVIFAMAILAGIDAVLAPSSIGDDNSTRWLFLAFWVLVPIIPTTLGLFVLPSMVGAVRFAFPRLNKWSIYLFILSAALGVLAAGPGRVGAGAVLYARPSNSWSTIADTGLILALLSGIASIILVNFNIVATTLTKRALNVGGFDLPAFVWGLTVAAMVSIVTLPIGFSALVLLLIDRRLQIGIFDPTVGGVSDLYRHMFWFAAHPALFNALLPAIGLIAVVLNVSPHYAPAAHRRLVLGMVVVGGINVLTWGAESMTVIEPVLAVVVSGFSLILVIPMVMITGDLLGAFRGTRICITGPTIYVLAFIYFFVNALAVGLLLGPLSVGLRFSNTAVSAAHIEFYLFGSVIAAFFAGLLFWWSKITGRGYSVFWSAVAAALFFEGVNLAIFPKVVYGLNSQLAFSFGHPTMYEQLQRISTAGAWLLGLGVALQVLVFVYSVIFTDNCVSDERQRKHQPVTD
jgi:cytochrome c oxidase subunit I